MCSDLKRYSIEVKDENEKTVADEFF